MRGRHGVAAVAVAAALFGGAQAQADSGSVNDPSGDLPDIIKLAYNNADSKVVVTMTYSGFRAQNESFYMRWGDGKYYQVFRPIGQEAQLRLNDPSSVRTATASRPASPATSAPR